MKKDRGFTLVELLVVVAIIVILLALLVPAMDKAVYQAELATCAARIKGAIGAVQTYAAGSNRMYPARKMPQMMAPRIFAGTAADDRPLLQTIMPYNKVLQCPLVSKPVDLESAAATSQVYASYSLYFGAQFPGNKGMKKIGDRWTWTDDFYDLPAKTYNLATLIGDMDIIYREPVAAASQLAQGSHQDADMKMQQLYVQGGDVYSAWRYSGNYKRGTVDLNHGREDGGVIRYDGITYDDDRMAKTPWDSVQFKGGHLMQVPKY